MRGTHSKPGEFVNGIVRVTPVNGVNYVFTYGDAEAVKIGWIPKSEGCGTEGCLATLLSDNSIEVPDRNPCKEINLPTIGANDFTMETWIKYPINRNTDREDAISYMTGNPGMKKSFEQNYGKQQTMLENLIETNKQAATQAAYLEAGRLANVTLANILAKRFPGLPETPFNALVLANIADQVAKNLKPNAKLAKLTGAMTTVAFMELYQMVDLEGMIYELMNDSSVKAYLDD